MTRRQPFEEKLAAGWPASDWRELGVVLAVSGGADSVALACGMVALQAEGTGQLAVAHFNHRWRGVESDADQAFVIQLCERLSLDCVTGSAEASVAERSDDASEASARSARYAFLQNAAEARGARYVATAHTTEDQAETVLHHVVRGTGLAGLAGIHRVRALGSAVTLIRPMLDVRRQEVLAYLAARAQTFREDQSNLDVRFTRNRIRHELLPLVAREYSSTVVDALVRLSAVADDAQRTIRSAAEQLLACAVLSADAGRVTIDCRRLAAEDRHLVREMFVALWQCREWPRQDMGFDQWNLLADISSATARLSSPKSAGSSSSAASSTKRTFPGAITAQRQGDELTLLAPQA